MPKTKYSTVLEAAIFADDDELIDLNTLEGQSPVDLGKAIALTVDTLQSTNTRDNYGRRLKQFEDWYTEQDSPPAWGFGLIQAYMGHIASQSPSVRAQSLAALKKLCLTLKGQGDLTHVDWLEVKAMKVPAQQPAPAGKHISDDDMARLLEACLGDDNPIIAARDCAMLATLQATGMRRAELTNLTVDDYDPERRRLQLRLTKNRQDRPAFINHAAAEYLQRWLDIRGAEPGNLFVKANRKGGLTATPLHPSTVYYILGKRCLEAGLAESYTPHDLRHTYITNLLAANVDIALASRMAGHSSVTMTARYDTRQEDEMRQAAARVYTPEI